MAKGFPERLIEVIEDSRLKKTEFARRIDVSQPHVSRMCSGETQPSSRTIKAICKEFNVNEDWLLYGRGPKRLSLSRDEEIEEMVNSAMRGSNEFKKSVIRMICSRTDDELKQLDDMLRAIYDSLPQSEAKSSENKKMAAARSGDRVEVSQVSEEEEEAALPPSYTGDI